MVAVPIAHQQRGRDRDRASRGAPTPKGNVTNGSSTPTRAAENAAVTYLTRVTDTNPKFIVLATDGQPNCPASGQMNDDTPGAIAAVTTAKTAGFPTFVVGISAGGRARTTALNVMAVAGGYPQVGQPTQYYPVTDTAEFADRAADAGRHGDDVHVLGPASAHDRRNDQPRRHRRQGDRRPARRGHHPGREQRLDVHRREHDVDRAARLGVRPVTAGTITSVTIVFNCHFT